LDGWAFPFRNTAFGHAAVVNSLDERKVAIKELEVTHA
jgi:hypothetical protein